MIYAHQFNGVSVRTGDVLCTVDGVLGNLYGRFWQLVGKFLPGKVDHCAIYLGPGGRCVEAGPGGVIVYDMPNNQWDSMPLADRRLFVDRLYGAAYPLANGNLSTAQEDQIRIKLAEYCLEQAELQKPYNFNFLDPDTEAGFYCSQFVYKAYAVQGIDLDATAKVASGGVVGRIVLPQEIWQACVHQRVSGWNG